MFEQSHGESPAIGLIVASLDYSPFWSKFTGAAEREAAKYGHLLTVIQHFNDLDQQRDAPNLLIRRRTVAGLLIVAESAPSLRWGNPVITSIDYNLDTLARQAVAKLVALIANGDDPTARRDDPHLRTYEIVRGQSIRNLH